jgi:hypothetical protein
METPEAATHVAETSDMSDTHAVGETATSKMGDAYAAAHVAQATHAVTQAMIEAAVVRLPAIKYGGVAIIAEIIRACRSTAVSRIVDGTGWAVGLRSSRLQSGKCSRGQSNASSQQNHFDRQFAAGHRSLLWGFAPQFRLIPK